MNLETAWRSSSKLSPWLAFHSTVTSSCTPIATIYNDWACTALLVAYGITNAASLLDTPETLHLRANSVRQITSNSAQLLRFLSHPSDMAIHDSGANESRNTEAVFELRSLTGLTWDQIARLFCVSRRSVHLWASGGPMSHENEEHLHRVLGILRRSDRGRPENTRAALFFANRTAAVSAFDLLMGGDYETATKLLGVPSEELDKTEIVPSATLLSERMPLPPDVLLQAKQDGGPVAPRRARTVRYRKVTRDS